MSSSADHRTCFIASPAGANLDVLTSALRKRGLRVLAPNDLEIGGDWVFDTQKQLASADLVIGVLTQDPSSSWVLFELGQASALGRRIVLITSPKADPIPVPLQQVLVLRTEVDNAEAIGFALDQLLAAPTTVNRARAAKSPNVIGLGHQTDILIARLEEALVSHQHESLEEVVADALKATGADIVVTSRANELRVDLAVWSDVLEPIIGNPLLIEVKARLQGKDDTILAVEQLASYVGAAGSRWGVLLYGGGPESRDDMVTSSHPNILVLSIRSLLENLRSRTFPELVRDLRNQRVHGVR